MCSLGRIRREDKIHDDLLKLDHNSDNIVTLKSLHFVIKI